jgi:WD40 repeat protein
VLRGHSGTVLAVAFAPGGSLLASADDEGTIRLWNPLDGTELGELADDARSLAFSPDGDVLASAGRDGKIRLWHPGDRTHTTIGAHGGPVLSLAFAPGRPLLASAGDDGSVRLWNPLDGTQVDELADDARALAFSPDGRTLASAGHGAGVVLWDLEDRPRSTQLGEVQRSHGLAFAPDGTRLASANDAGDVCVYDLTGGADPTPLAGHTCEILSVAYSPDGTLLATGDFDGAIRIWETTRGTLVRRLAADREMVLSLAFNGTGTLLAAAIGSRIHVWEVTRGFVLVATLGLGQRPVTSVAFASDGTGRSLLVSADDGGQLAIRDAHDGTTVATSEPAVSVAVDPGGAMVVGVGGDGFVRQWDLGTGLTDRQVFSPALQRPKCVALRPDGQMLAGAGSDGTITLWNAADSDVPVAMLPGHDGVVRALAFSPDGTLLASAGSDGTIRMWDARDGSASRILIDRAGVVRSVAFAPDGTTLVSVGDDGRINRWNPLSGRPLSSGRRQVRPLPSVPGIRSDEPSRDDLLGLDADVEMLATLIAAASTEPPLAVALLGEWGTGKSSVMLQVQDAVDRLAARARGDAGDNAYASNVCQIRFNAWHYSDDEVWTGLIDHLFRKLAAAADGGQTPPDPDQVRAERDRIRQELEDQRQRCAELDSQRHQMARGLAALGRTAWRNRGPLLLRGLLTAAAFVFITFQLLSNGLVTALSRAWNLARTGQQAADWPANSLAEEARQARERLAALEDQLAQVDAAARLALLLNRPSDLDPYGARRGLLGQVHRDLEQLTTDLERLRKERQVAGQLVPPPLERVILYIDDLDRCPPARVVEVLAAVHLMLALPLFVVIVAVDPRWLLEALRHHYRDLFTGAFDQGDHPATPLDYLDKIFQIPFTVRSLSAADAAGFLGSLLGREQADTGQGEGSLAPSAVTASAPLTPAAPPAPQHQPPSADPPSPTAPSDPADPPSPADRPSPARPDGEAILGPRPGGLVLRAPETQFIVRLGALLSTPRAAKKLVNLYRLVRIGIPEEDLPTFIGLGGYQVVQILLAVLVGTPDAAPAIFTAIRSAAYDADIVNVVHAADPASGPRVAGLISGIRPQAHEAVADIRAYQRWCPELARYSFYTRSLV